MQPGDGPWLKPNNNSVAVNLAPLWILIIFYLFGASSHQRSTVSTDTIPLSSHQTLLANVSTTETWTINPFHHSVLVSGKIIQNWNGLRRQKQRRPQRCGSRSNCMNPKTVVRWVVINQVMIEIFVNSCFMIFFCFFNLGIIMSISFFDLNKCWIININVGWRIS